jgi:hypothetical protein
MDRLLRRKSNVNSGSHSETTVPSSYGGSNFQKISAKQLARYLNDFQMRLDTYGQAQDISFDVEVFHNGNTLYRFEASDSMLITTASNDFKDDVTEVIDRSGMYNVEVEFNPVPHNGFGLHGGNIVIADATEVPAKNRTDNNFADWFSHLCLSLGEKIHLIPDTSFFRRCYYSNYIKDVLHTDINKNNLLLKIPRLEILDLENRFNSNKANKTVEKNILKLPLQFPNKAIEEKAHQRDKESRIAFNTIAEILSMKNNGAELLPDVEVSLLQSFSPLAGRGLTDAWIRREISNALSSLGVQDKARRNDKVERSDTVVFLTCDLMNALAAIAENFNTFYFLRIEEDKISLGFDIYRRLALLIINTAIQFEQCDCVITTRSQTHKLRFRGMWKGKTVYDWKNNAIFYDNIQ